MKYAFIVNPESGQGKQRRYLEPKINKLIEDNPKKDIKIYYTRGEKDATILADMIAKETKGEVTVFACGGDGTLQEVATGLYGHENAVMGVVPVGSGNDFVRTLGGDMKAGEKYLDLQAQLDAPSKEIDLIRLTWTENRKKKIAYVDNGINIGFDGNTCILAHDYKKIPGVSGTGSYILALAKNLIEKKGGDVKIVADGKKFFDGPMLLATVANGAYCGGGFKSCPNADLSDGLLEIFVVNDMSRSRFLQLVPKYKSGDILTVPSEDGKLYKYAQVKKVEITPNGAKTMQFVGDGETFETGKLLVEVVHNALKVVCIK